MIEITPNALEMCTATVRQLSTQANTKCLRLIEREDAMVMSFELPRSGDELLRSQGMTVLAVPTDISDAVSDMTLDVRDDGRFVLA